jgi:hypothetical protein
MDCLINPIGVSHAASIPMSQQSLPLLEQAIQIEQNGADAVLLCNGCVRFPAVLLVGGRLAAERAWRLEGVDERLKLALAVLGQAGRFALVSSEPHRSFLADQPFAVQVESDGALVLQPRAEGGKHLESSFAHAWMTAVETPRVTFDLVNVTHLTSVLIAWMLQVAQSARPAQTCIAHASPGVTAQLCQLRLDHLMTLV